jgi:hypothetical protein
MIAINPRFKGAYIHTDLLSGVITNCANWNTALQYEGVDSRFNFKAPKAPILSVKSLNESQVFETATGAFYTCFRVGNFDLRIDAHNVGSARALANSTRTELEGLVAQADSNDFRPCGGWGVFGS